MNITPKKSLGQNFLRSEKALEQIAGALSFTKDTTIIEIGPGEGVLTEKLLAKGNKVLAIEKDDRLIPLLEEKFKNELKQKKLELIHKDVLQYTPPQKEYVLIANIPYYITGAILEHFLENSEHKPQGIVLLVQKEVAERITSKDGKESILSLSVKYFGIPKLIAKVPKGAFFPSPKVDSAIISITDIHTKITKEESAVFFRLIKSGFSHKRKKLVSNLKENGFSEAKVLHILQKYNQNKDVRAEKIDISIWIELAKAFS